MGPKPKPLHRFRESAAKASAIAEEPWMETIYRRAFNGFESMSTVRSDGWAQRGGIDRKINLVDARSVFVEEKFRFVEYSDILLERWSDRRRRKPGWIQQRLLCDYVSYIVVPSRTMLLLPYLDLRRAWLREGRRWVRQYKARIAENLGYETESVAIPKAVLLKAIVAGFEFHWTADEEEGVHDAAQLSFDWSERL